MAYDEDDTWSESGSSDAPVKPKAAKSSKASTSKRKSSSGASSSNSGLSCEYLADINKTFERFDVKKEGKFEAKQLKFAMRALGFEPKMEEIKRLTEQTATEDGYIIRKDFVKLMVNRLTEKNVNAEILKAFQLFDSEHKGKITVEDLERVAKELGENLTPEELAEMIEEADLDGDKAVDSLEFLRIMKKTCLY